MKHPANALTAARIALSITLAFTETFSAAFFALYALCGISDMADGFVARKTHTESELGARLDSAADFVFVAVCLVKLLPFLDVQLWLLLWVLLIAVIKAANLVVGYVRRHRLVTLHNAANKAVGLLLFLLPFTFPFIDTAYSASVVCAAATFAAVRELWLIGTEK